MDDTYAPFVPTNETATPVAATKPKLPSPPVHEKKPRKKRAVTKTDPVVLLKRRKATALRKKRAVIPAKPTARRQATVAKAAERHKSVLTPKGRALLAAADKAHTARIAQRPVEAKYTLSEALAIGGSLQKEDLKLFGQIESDLRALPKDARARILAAVGRVFA